MKSKTVLATLVLPLGLTVALLSILSAGSFISQASALTANPMNETLSNGAARANVIVQFGRQDLTVRPITFTAPISGLRALELTGLDVITSETAFGAVVCSIGGVGCPASNCFCSSNYWGYNYWDGSAWQGYMVGAASSVITDAAVEGWRWGPFGSAVLFPDLPPAPPLIAAASALDWLRPRQVITDGGYGSMGSTVETLMAIGANNLRAADWKRQPDSASLLSYAMGHGAAYANTGADASAKVATGLSASEGCWPLNALRPMDFYSPTSGAFVGAYGVGSGTQAWAILGTRSLSQSVPVTAVQYLRNAQQPNGGWEWQAGFGSDTNSTALAIQALVSFGEPLTSSAIISGLNYLKSAQNADGGFTYDPTSPWGTASDTDSTAYAVQALLAAGQDPITGTWVVTSSNPISYLLGMQLSDGSFEYQKGLGANLLATQQAVPALLGRPFPLKVADLSQCCGVFMPVVLR